jgi:uncharacterized alpha-E superfamily protein
VLSRIAESLYWMGRYIERADGTGRILDAHVHSSIVGQGPLGVDAGSRRLLEVMGVSAPLLDSTVDVPGMATGYVLELLAYDETQPTSIVASITSTRENARGVREVISSDTWEAINATYNRLPGYRAQARRRGPDPFLAFVRTQCALINGHVDATLVRDDGWRFIMLGRSLERVDMMARLLDAELGRGADAADWLLLLRSCGGYEAFLRHHRGRVTPAGVAQFLVTDTLFPRSLLHGMEIASRILSELEPRADSPGQGGRARRLLGAAHARAAYTEPDEMINVLPSLLEEIQEALAQTHAALSDRFFRQLVPVQWSVENPR